MNKSCKTCRHFAEKQAECRRYPPDVAEYDENPEHGVWPHVTIHDWCGEYSNIDPATAAFTELERVALETKVRLLEEELAKKNDPDLLECFSCHTPIKKGFEYANDNGMPICFNCDT